METKLPWDGGWGRKRGVSGGESHLESTESVADERERITAKPRNQNAGEGGNLRGRGNSAGAGVRYTERPLSKAGPDCVGRVRVRESGTPPNLDEGPITPLRQAQQAERGGGAPFRRLFG